MSAIRTVTLEILRHGPPLTQYLGLCGNHPNVTIEVPYEHAEFLARHEVLTYKHEMGAASEQDRKSAREHRELQLP